MEEYGSSGSLKRVIYNWVIAIILAFSVIALSALGIPFVFKVMLFVGLFLLAISAYKKGNK